MTRDSRRGGGGVGRSGGPCGRPVCTWLMIQGQDILDLRPLRATTRAPSPHPLRSRPYATYDGIEKTYL